MRIVATTLCTLATLTAAFSADSFLERFQNALRARDTQALGQLVEGDPAHVLGYAFRSAPATEWNAQLVRSPGGSQYLHVSGGQDRQERLHPVLNERVLPAIEDQETFGYFAEFHRLTVRITAKPTDVRVYCEATLAHEGVPEKDALLRLHPSLHVHKVELAGSEVKATRAGSYLFVPRSVASRVSLRLEYTIASDASPGNWRGEQGVVLLDRWVPQAGRLPFGYRLAVTVPKGWHAVATGTLSQRVDTEEGSEFVFDASHPSGSVALCAGSFLQVAKRFEEGTVSAWVLPGSRQQAEHLLKDAGPLIGRLSSWFGPLPWKDFHFVQAPDGETRGTAGNLVIWPAAIFANPALREVARAWWGGAVPDDGASGYWSDAVAGYSWFLYRRRPSEDAPAALDIINTPRPAGRLPGGWADYALSECKDLTVLGQASVARLKGPIVLTYLERQIGFEPMLKALRAFREATPPGQVGTWTRFEALVNETSGKNMKRFFDEWVRRAGLPDIVWAELRLQEEREGVTVVGTLEQVAPAYELEVEVLATGPGGRRWSETVKTSAESTQLQLELPFVPRSLVLDPYLMIPRAFRPDSMPFTLPSLETYLRQGETVVVVPKAQKETVAALLAPFRQLTAVVAEEVKEEELQDKNLVLLGTPESNPVWARMERLCPFLITAGRVAIDTFSYPVGECVAMGVVELEGPRPRFAVFATELRLGPTGADHASAIVLDRSGKILAGVPARFTKGDSVWLFHRPE